MIIEHNVSLQAISWVKSNRREFEQSNATIENVFYPEEKSELVDLIRTFQENGEQYDIIGYCSNTLLMPSYRVKNLVCTKRLNTWNIENGSIHCLCGVNVSALAKAMIKEGYKGFEGLTDLPGTIAAAVYGNSGCRHCSINELLKSFDLLTIDGKIKRFTKDDLNLSYRSSSLKRKEFKGVIIEVELEIVSADALELELIAKKNHQIRLEQQPSGKNNLGTTFLGCQLTKKGIRLARVENFMYKYLHIRDKRISFPLILRMIGKGQFAPYVYYWNRYMFLDERSHKIFPSYCEFLKTLYQDLSFEIEIRK